MNTWELQAEIHKSVKENLKSGMTELEVGKIVTEICPDWQGDLISGERTADIEGGPTERVIKDGDVVLLDLQVKSGDKWSDLTRVYFVGEISDEKRNAYNSVKEALTEGERILKSGTKASDIWHKMREVIGSPYAFDHHGGHRVGDEEIVIAPRFVPENDDVLEVGMIVTLEPGFYKPNDFGIRLENNYLITEEGFTRLDELSLDIDDYIVKG